MAASHDDIRAKLRTIGKRRAKVARERSEVAADTTRAVRAAREAGIPVAEIARLAGLSREAAYKVLRRAER
jgi:DNA-binding phage protein